MDDELSMLLRTVIPIAAVALISLILYWLLPFWLFVVAVVAILAVAASSKARAAIKNALMPPPEVESQAPPSDSAEKK